MPGGGQVWGISLEKLQEKSPEISPAAGGQASPEKVSGKSPEISLGQASTPIQGVATGLATGGQTWSYPLFRGAVGRFEGGRGLARRLLPCLSAHQFARCGLGARTSVPPFAGEKA